VVECHLRVLRVPLVAAPGRCGEFAGPLILMRTYEIRRQEKVHPGERRPLDLDLMVRGQLVVVTIDLMING
jgi:hypothetical protein